MIPSRISYREYPDLFGVNISGKKNYPYFCLGCVSLRSHSGSGVAGSIVFIIIYIAREKNEIFIEEGIV